MQFEPFDQVREDKDLQKDCQKYGHKAENGYSELAEIVSAWGNLSKPLRAAILGIIRSQTRDLSINGESQGSGSASRELSSSRAGAKPELPVCGQVGRSAQSNNFSQSNSAPVKTKITKGKL